MKTKLKQGETYMVWEPGMNEWLVMEYIGYNKLRDEHIFVSIKDNEVWMFVDTKYVDDEVK